MATTKTSDETFASRLGLDRLAQEAMGLGQAFAERSVSTLTDRVDGLTDSLAGTASDAASPVKKTTAKAAKNMVQGDSKPKAAAKAVGSGVTDKLKDGVSSVKDKVTDAIGGGGSSGDKKLKVTNIVEELDLPVSRELAYAAWTNFEEFPSFMKKVESVDQKSDEKLEWTAQILWSHRSWTAEIVEQVPNERIVWKSKGDKGHVDGAVTFHELAPDLTRILVVLEYHPKGLFEHTGNIWRAQGRRARLELKHFRRYVSSQALLHPEEIDGWTGEIHDGKVTEKDSGSGGAKKSSSSSSNSSGSSNSSNSSGRSRKSASSAKKTSSSSSSSGRSGAKKASSSARSGAKKASSSARSGAKRASSSGRSGAKKASSSSSRSGGQASKTAKTAAKKTAKKTSTRSRSS